MNTRSARPSAARLDCERHVLTISRYVDGDLSAAERRTLSAHLKRCPCCQSMAEAIQGTVSACRKARSARIPADVRARAKDRVKALLQAARSQKPEARGREWTLGPEP
jgi:anti-sigma factor RsiW